MNPINFIHDLKWDDIPAEVRHQAKRCLLDTMGIAAGARLTETARIMYDHAARFYGGDGSKLWWDGRSVSSPGASLAHGMMIDSLDMHDSCRPVKGHAGVAQVPAAFDTLSLADGPVSGKEFLTTLVMAYDISIRTGKAQHNTVCDYHTSGSWNTAGTAAIVARRMGLSHEQTRHALGIAEYHGPRSQMMRCIEHPTMLKDGSGWGAMTGLAAGFMAADGFTGAPAITMEGDDVTEYWADLGETWSLMIQFFKAFAVCYWAQPAITGAMALQKTHGFKAEDITKLQVHTFHESAALATREPKDSDQAQYSLPYPMGAALVYGRLNMPEITGDALTNPEVLRISNMVELIEDDEYNSKFPADRLSRVIIETKDGQTYNSGTTTAKWGDLTHPPADEELLEKFSDVAQTYLSAERTKELSDALWHIEEMEDVREMKEILERP